MGLRSAFARILSRPRSWFSAVSRRSRIETEMDAELADHLARLTADLIRAGHAPAVASRNARIALGPALIHKEQMRASLGLRWGDEFLADLRYAARLLRKSPGFTAIATLSLALAIGANSTIFSVAKRVLMDRLHVSHPEELRLFKWTGDKNVAVHNLWGDFNNASDGAATSSSFSYPAFEQLRRDNRVLQDLFAFKGAGRLNVTIPHPAQGGEAQVLQAEMVSGNYFSELRVPAQLGRTIEPIDDMDGAPPVAMLSAGLWERAFGSARDVIGRTIKVNMAAVTIVGVAPRSFTGAKGAQVGPDIFLPFSTQPLVMPRGKGGSILHDADAQLWWLNIMGRVKPGVSMQQAQAALNVSLDAVARASLQPERRATMPRLYLEDGSRGLFEARGMFEKPIRVLMAVVGLVLLLACANIASLLLARSASRQREISVRMAVGAGRARILRQVLTESLLISALGGAMGAALALLTQRALPALLSNPWEQDHISFSFDWGVFAFTATITLLTGLLFGVAPAWMATRTEVSAGLKEQSQSTTRRRKGLTGKAIVAFQVMLSTVLVAGALLFVRTLVNLGRIDPGFRTDHLLLFAIEQPNSRYPHPKEIELYRRIEEGVRALPGVESVTYSEVPYLSDSMENTQFIPEGEKKDGNKDQSTFDNVVSAGFFHTMGIPMLAGREFDARDTAASQHVAVITESLAKKAFPGVSPVGRHFLSHENEREGRPGVWIEVVGVSADTRYWSVKREPEGMFYELPAQSNNLDGMTYEIRTHMDSASLAPAIRKVVQSVDPDLPIEDLRTQQEQIDSTLQTERIFASLTAGFGMLALALACVGVYGIMAYTVAQRTNEIGIRLALGAQPAQVRGMILRESSWIAMAGVAAGLAAALGLANLVKTMLFGIQPWDPSTLGGGALILLAVALAASWIPARRAAGVQPVEALRHE
jgi:predicted permease